MEHDMKKDARMKRKMIIDNKKRKRSTTPQENFQSADQMQYSGDPMKHLNPTSLRPTIFRTPFEDVSNTFTTPPSAVWTQLHGFPSTSKRSVKDHAGALKAGKHIIQSLSTIKDSSRNISRLIEQNYDQNECPSNDELRNKSTANSSGNDMMNNTKGQAKATMQEISSTPISRNLYSNHSQHLNMKNNMLYTGTSSSIQSPIISTIDAHEGEDHLIDNDSIEDIPSLIEEEGSNIVHDRLLGKGDYWDIGDPTWTCKSCGAMMWYEERVRNKGSALEPSFSLCCMHGKVQLPLLKEPPEILKKLLDNKDTKGRYFAKNIRKFNMMFSFTSMGGKVDSSINEGRGPYVFRLHGQNYHRIGSLLPNTGSSPKFLQLYIHDTDNEVSNRLSTVRSGSNSDSYDADIVDDLKKMLDEHNPLAKAFRMARDRFSSNERKDVKLKLIGRRGADGRRYNLPTASEVAALIVGDICNSLDERDIIIETQSGSLQRISELHPSYLALQYPLLFPYGEDGYTIDIPLGNTSNTSSRKRKRMSMREFFAYRIQEREAEVVILHLSKKLFQQFLVDGYTMIEAERLSFIRNNQPKLRAETYDNFMAAARRGNNNPSILGKRIVLPSSFTGGARYMVQNYLDTMALCKSYGYPDLFITFTCNPKWPEITRFVSKRGRKPEDRPDILCRVFKMKLDQLIKDLREKQIFGRVQAVVYTVEFQKRGLPHAHILLFMHRDDKFPTAEDIDNIICAEIPNKEEFPLLYEVVKAYMIHGPCGALDMHSPCMKDKRCSKHFPKKNIEKTTVDEEGYPIYRRRVSENVVERNGVLLDNRFVVPYNSKLLIKYQAHINVEWCNQSRSIKYLFKYINKGYDRVTATVCKSREGNDLDNETIDEIKNYYDCRYISPCEASWRIFGFTIHYRYPAVERLSFHLPNEQSVVFQDEDTFDSVLNRPGIDNSMFLGWMECNKKYEEARRLSYIDFPKKWVWKQDLREWRPRVRGTSIGRIHHVPLGCGELYYLMLLLNKVKGPTCYDDIRTINGILYPSFKEACYALGLLDDDKEYIEGIREASFWGSAHYLRALFCMLLISESLSKPELVWEQTWEFLADDVLHRQRRILGVEDLQLSELQLKNYTLAEIEKLLMKNGSSLCRYPDLPFPSDMIISEGNNKLIQDELCYDRASLQAEYNSLSSNLSNEQKQVFETIMNAVSSGQGGVYFIYGHGGTGKTFIWRTLSAAIRSKGEIVLTVASSGIASLLLIGGRTAHSRFGIPININKDSTCNIRPGTDLAELLINTKLIIWDEAPMIHKYCFEALDKSLRDILHASNQNSYDKPFGGKVVVFGGDFRQILPVVPKGGRQDIVFSALNSSYLWRFCKVLRLTKNMRLQNGCDDANANEIKEFSDWILKVGDGCVGNTNDGEAEFEIPEDILITNTTDPLASIVDFTYPLLLENLRDPSYFQDRAILAPTNEIVDIVNEYMLLKLDGEEKVYLSSDKISNADTNAQGSNDLYSPDFLNSIKCSGLPNHKLKLKVGVPVMLIRNIDQQQGLCNGTRLQVNRLGNHVIEATIITGRNIGLKVFIPRMLLTPSNSRLPFRMQRRQFPPILCFAMTINKSQGQSLSHVGLYLPRPIFCHGQLYVAISRVKSKSGLKVLICDKEGRTRHTTTNVVYKEVFQNL